MNLAARALACMKRLGTSGAAAVEFAIIAPIFMSFIIGTTYVGLMMLTLASMHYAVQDAARCMSVKTTVCGSTSTAVSYARSKYYGVLLQPTFAASTPACGNQVRATVNFSLYTGVATLTVPLSASACFP